MLQGKELADEFFDIPRLRKTEEATVECKQCKATRKIKSGSGYSNLVSHIYSVHKEYMLLGRDKESNQRLLIEAFIPKKFRDYYGWIRWIIIGLYPFSFCEKEINRDYTKLDKICVDTLHKYIKKIVNFVENEIRKVLPNTFALVFDGWRSGDTHYVADSCSKAEKSDS
jgi:hypothetical protein